MTTTAPKKIVAKFPGHCPICDRKIKSQSESIAYSKDLPVSHWDCYEDRDVVPTNKYGASEEAFARLLADHEAGKLRWAEACERHAAKATAKAAPDAPAHSRHVAPEDRAAEYFAGNESIVGAGPEEY